MSIFSRILSKLGFGDKQAAAAPAAPRPTGAEGAWRAAAADAPPALVLGAPRRRRH